MKSMKPPPPKINDELGFRFWAGVRRTALKHLHTIDAEYKRASHTAIDSVGGACIALYLLGVPCFPSCIHHFSDANVRASPRLNRAYEHSPSVPRLGAFGSEPWFGPVAPYMALRGGQSVGTQPPILQNADDTTMCGIGHNNFAECRSDDIKL